MATTKEFIEYIHELSNLKDRLTVRKMFGEYAIYVDGKVVALACDNSLYLKPTQAISLGQSQFPEQPPYPGAKPYLVIDELLDDPEELKAALLSTANVLPVPKPRISDVSRKKRRS